MRLLLVALLALLAACQPISSGDAGRPGGQAALRVAPTATPVPPQFVKVSHTESWPNLDVYRSGKTGRCYLTAKLWEGTSVIEVDQKECE